MVNSIYKCEKCGSIYENIGGKDKAAKCCGEKMTLMEPKTADWQGEKHVPKITIEGNKVTVDVGVSMGTPHPMTEEHWIMWIDLFCQGNCYKRKFLKPGDEPKTTFVVASTEGVWAREYCNLHGLWKST